MSRWTEKEKEFLRENYPTQSFPFLCKHLKRSETAIRAYALSMGLKRKYGMQRKAVNLMIERQEKLRNSLA